MGVFGYCPEMKFVIVTGIFPPEIGGPARVMFDMAEELRSRSHEVLVVTYGDQVQKQEAVVRISRGGHVLKRYIRMCRAIRAHLQPQTVVIATDVFSVGIPTRLALIGKKNTFFVRLGGEWAWEDAVTKGRYSGTLRDFWGKYTDWRKMFQRLNYQWITYRARSIFVTSSFLGDILTQYLHLPKQMIQLAENQASFNSVSHQERNTTQPLRILYVGRFAPVKNVCFLARVLRTCEQRGLSFVATLVGDGPDVSKIQQIISGSKNTVIMTPVDRATLAEVYATHDVFVLPSLSDICPNAVLEALAHGLPCLMTTEHGLSRPLLGTQECDPQNEQAWVDVLSSWMQHPEQVAALHKQIQIKRGDQKPTLADQIISFAQVK